MGLLTDFFLPVAQQYVAAKFPVGSPVFAAGPGFMGKSPGTGMIGGGATMPAMSSGEIIEGAGMIYDCASGPPPPDCGASAVYKKVCGEYRWVYPKRRRRKQLLTKGDAKGLAALKGILGNGKAMEVWIATHG